MTSRTLVLTQAYIPHKIVGFDRAVGMLFLGKIEVVEEYDEVLGIINQDRLRDFPHLARAYKRTIGDGLGDLEFRVPSVAVLTRQVGSVKRGVKFSRINVFTRDGYRCQYCGDRRKAADLNFDHVIPRKKGGQTVWENIVASCYDCNERKAGRTPEEAGMTLRRKPYKPKTLPMLGPKFDPREVPPIWMSYCSSFFEDDPPQSTLVA